MKKFLFSVCAVLAVFGCGGDPNGLPPLGQRENDYDSYGYCRYNNRCEYMSVNDCYNYYGGSDYGNDNTCGSSSGGYTGSYGSVYYEGETYKTVTIGTQTWMAENLNYNPNTGKSACYDNKASNCTVYGRLYDWETALTVCPSGWHLPSNAEWEVLVNYAGNSATKLKAISGWNSGGNGTDQYGFSALPGGDRHSDGSFNHGGAQGLWWSADEYSSSNAYSRNIDNTSARLDNYDKLALYSVRCLLGYSSSSSVRSSSSSGGGYTGSYGSVYYESQTYKTVAIGTQTWLAENLNYAPNTGTFISCNTYDCSTYGRLYDWSTAMSLPSSCNSSTCSNQIQSKHRGICPNGWHIPSNDDWDKLMNYVGGSSTAGMYLKSTSGWYNNGNGTDQYRFSALPSGSGYWDGNFDNVGDNGYWWSATESSASYAYFRDMNYYGSNVNRSTPNKAILFSVRCVQD